MVEIYLMTSLAPIPFSTMANRSGAVWAKLFKIHVCSWLSSLSHYGMCGIYAVLVQSIATDADIMGQYGLV